MGTGEVDRDGGAHTERAVGVVHAAGDDGAIVHKDAAHRDFVSVERTFGLAE